MHSGVQPVIASHGLLSTIAWGLHGVLTYALEGSIFSTGSAIQWLRDELRILQSAAERERLAASVPDTHGVYFVPAFTGLGAPHWDMYARGLLIGLTRGTSRAHIVRAALEAMAYQTCDVVNSMIAAAGVPVSVACGWGAAVNDLAMQFQSDMLQAPVQRPQVVKRQPWGCLSGRLSRGLVGKPGSDCGELAPAPYLYATDVRGSS
jgi:glycerol kinase